MASLWYVYLVRCSDHSLYAGITTDLTRRVSEHNFSKQLAAKYTRVRRPVKLVYSQELCSRSEASRAEYQLKKLTKKAKEQLVNQFSTVLPVK